jgi:hypothetical protein
MGHELRDQGLAARGGDPEGVGNQLQHDGGLPHGAQLDETDAVRKGGCDVGGDLEGEPGFADPARTGQGDERDRLAEQEVAHGVDRVFAADEGTARQRQRRDVSWDAPRGR